MARSHTTWTMPWCLLRHSLAGGWDTEQRQYSNVDVLISDTRSIIVSSTCCRSSIFLTFSHLSFSWSYFSQGVIETRIPFPTSSHTWKEGWYTETKKNLNSRAMLVYSRSIPSKPELFCEITFEHRCSPFMKSKCTNGFLFIFGSSYFT